MIKRIAILFAITGFGHAFSIVGLKFMAHHGSNIQMARMGEAESLIQLMIGLIGFGMQSDAIRNIALNQNWKEKLKQAQTARITLAILLMAFSLFSLSKSIYSCFLIAPLLASSSDYALYARGFPITASLIALARVITPLLIGIVSIFFWPDYLFTVYVCAIFLTYFATNIVMSLFLKVPLFYMPTFASLKLYLKTIPLGIINICSYFFCLGVLLFAQLFFGEKELVICFLALKFYTVYKGAIRVITQAFITQMTDYSICRSLDQISILLSLSFFGSVVLFPSTFISLFFGDQFKQDQRFFIFLAISSVAFSIFQSSLTRAVLEHKDFKLMKVAILSVCSSIIFLAVAIVFSNSIDMVSLSLLVGEIFFSCGLALSFLNKAAIRDRIAFLLLSSIGLFVPLAGRLIFSESALTYILSFTIMGLTLLLSFYKNFTLPLVIEKK